MPTPPPPRPRRFLIWIGVLALLLAGCHARRTTVERMDQAQRYHQHGELRSAVIELKNVIQQEPDHALARLRLAEIYIEQGDPLSAEKELRRAGSLGLAPHQVWPLLAKALLMQGQFQRLLDECPDGKGTAGAAPLAALRADALTALGRQSDAAALLDDAIARTPNHSDLLLAKASMAMQAAAPEQAASLVAQILSADPWHEGALRMHGDLQRMAGQRDGAMAAYRQLLLHHPANAQAHIDLANLYIDAGRFAEARSEIEAARRIAPGMLGALYALALVDFRQDKHQAALDSLLLILRAAPEHMPSVLLAGAVRLAMGAHQQAEQHLSVFLAAFPHHPYATKLLATIRLQNGNPEAALALLAPLMAASGNDAELLALAAEAHLRARHFNQASALFNQASALRPDMPMLHTAQAVSRLGIGDTDRAIAELERASALDDKSVRTKVLLVMSYLRNQASDKAMAVVEQMEKQGKDPIVANLKGGIYLAKQDPKAARSHFEQALKLDPSYLPALDNLAQLDLIEKQPAAAQARYQLALQQAPSNIAIMEAIARLQLTRGNQGEALRWLERAHAASPEALPTALRLADLYLRTGAVQKGLTLARQSQASHPADADTLAMVARAQQADGDAAGALASMNKLAVLLPRSASIQVQIARLQAAAQDTAAALASIRRALALEPGFSEAQAEQARIMLAAKQYDGARTVAIQLQKNQATQTLGDKLEGDVLIAQGKADLAIVPYARAYGRVQHGYTIAPLFMALHKAGKHADADARMLAYLNGHDDDLATRLLFASSKMGLGDYRVAIAQFESALAKAPDNVIALNDMAWACQQIRDPRALAFAERAFGLARTNPAVMDTLAWILIEKGNLPRALPLLREAAKRAPVPPDIQLHLAIALSRSGAKVEARTTLLQLLERHKDYAQRPDVQALQSIL